MSSNGSYDSSSFDRSVRGSVELVIGTCVTGLDVRIVTKTNNDII